MFADPKIYTVDNLKPHDKELVEIYGDVKRNILNNDAVDEFVQQKNVKGTILASIYKEVLGDFVDFLRENVEYRKMETIISKIDGYSNEEAQDKK